MDIGSYIILYPIIGLLVSMISVVSKTKTSIKLVSAISAIASLLIIYVGFVGFQRGLSLEYTLFDMPEGSTALSIFSKLTFKVDALSAVFLVILGILSFVSSIFGIEYMEKYHGNPRNYAINYPLMILTMYLVVISWNLAWFIVFWELMSLFSQFLVAFEGKDFSVKAARKYFLMTKAGADFLILSIIAIIMMITGFKASYDAVSTILPSYLSSHPEMLYFMSLCTFVGLGVKAGMVPLHSWLPEAHPAAPAPISAMLSGIMIKVPIYMMFRFFFTFFPINTNIGLILALLGTVTMIVGGMLALVQDDAKILLAYSSVGQIGYILFAMGAGIYLISKGEHILGVIALIAAIYHFINHAIFKGLLFLTAGSVYYATGTKDLNVIGGLAKSMPLTTFSAFIAVLSISGVPSLNGFVSKWMIFSSTLPSKSVVSFLGIVALIMSAVTSGYMLKFFTASFLKPEKTKLAANEVPSLMKFSQIILSVACIFLGVYPQLPITMATRALESIGISMEGVSLKVFPGVVLPGIGNFVPFVVLIMIFMIAPIVSVLVRATRHTSVWTCGYPRSTSGLPARGYYKDFINAFPEVFFVTEALSKLATKIINAVKRQSLDYEDLSYDLSAMMSIALIFLLLGVMLMLWGVVL